MSESAALEWTIVVVVGMTLIHLTAPYVHAWAERHGHQLNSLGRGLAVAYVFLHLFRELADGKDLVGPHIFLIVLGGFLVYYIVEAYVASRLLHEPADSDSAVVRLQFGTVLLLKWIYSWLIIYALPDAIRLQAAHVIPAVLAICLHLLHDDVELAERYGKHYSRKGRYVLASAPLVGWVCDLYFFETDEFLSAVLTAVLAGSVLYTTFSGELDNHRKSHLPSFLTGILLFVVLYYLAE